MPAEWTGTVVTRAFMSDVVDHIVAVGKQEIHCRSSPTVSIQPGTEVHLSVDPAKVTLVPCD